MSGLVGFVSQSGGRGTLPVIHGCLSTIVLCTWNALHLNLPADNEPSRTKFLRKAKWMMIAILAPEAISILALREWSDTNMILKKIRGLESRAPISYQQEQIKVARPFDTDKDAVRRSIDITDSVIEKLDAKDNVKKVITDDSEKDPTTIVTERAFSGSTCVASDTASDRDLEAATHSASDCSWKRVHAFFINMGGFVLVSGNERYRLCTPQFLVLLENGLIRLPSLSQEEIRDKSKDDALTKAWACIQLIWLFTYLIGRVAVHLPITTLELFTVGVACCTFFTYGAWFQKPKDVDCPIEIPLEPVPGCVDEACRLLQESDHRYATSGRRVSFTENPGRTDAATRLFDLAYLPPMLLFGACHLLGWNFFFCSPIEKILWQACSTACLVLPPSILALTHITTARGWNAVGLMPVMFAIYGISRIYLCIDMFAGLRRVPYEDYNDMNWSQYIPHIGS